jgi:hypothetical protein
VGLWIDTNTDAALKRERRVREGYSEAILRLFGGQAAVDEMQAMAARKPIEVPAKATRKAARKPVRVAKKARRKVTRKPVKAATRVRGRMTKRVGKGAHK